MLATGAPQTQQWIRQRLASYLCHVPPLAVWASRRIASSNERTLGVCVTLTAAAAPVSDGDSTYAARDLKSRRSQIGLGIIVFVRLDTRTYLGRMDWEKVR